MSAPTTATPTPKPCWLDMDPGHDDAVCLALALHTPAIELVGVSSVGGNAPQSLTHVNCARLLEAFQAPPPDVLPLFRGADDPLVKPRRTDAGIHGEDGLGGVEGLPPIDSPGVQARLCPQTASGGPGPSHAILGLASAIRARYFNPPPSERPQKVTILATGPLTNIALFVKTFPELLDGVSEIVSMGGAVGVGNRSPVAEFNILVDPEAASIVYAAPVPVVMIGLNVTHTAIFTPELHRRLLRPSPSVSDSAPSLSTLRTVLSTAMTYFASTYASTFHFTSGPPLHDALTAAYIIDPTLLRGKRYRVDVDCANGLTMGATVVDLWDYTHPKGDLGWATGGRNVWVAEELDVPRFWDIFFNVVDLADLKVSHQP